MINIGFFIILFLGMTNFISAQNDCFAMLNNQRITKKSWLYLNQDEGKVYKKNSDLSESDNLKMKKNSWDGTYVDQATGQKFSSKEKTNASFKFTTLGYKISDQRQDVGFDFSVLNLKKKANDPYIFRIVNNSQRIDSKDLGKLHEVGFVFDNWPQYWPATKEWTGNEYSFKENYRIEELDQINVRFKFKLVNYNTPLNQKLAKEKWSGSYVTCDFRFNEYDENGKVLQSYLLSVVFSNPLHVDYNDNPNDNILFEASAAAQGNLNILMLHGNKIGIKEINMKNTWEDVVINFKTLVDKYFIINKNHKNIITGLDIYSATRDSNLTYDIQDVQVNGCKGR